MLRRMYVLAEDEKMLVVVLTSVEDTTPKKVQKTEVEEN